MKTLFNICLFVNVDCLLYRHKIMKILLLIAFLVNISYSASDSFYEELVVTDLDNGLVSLHFNFVTKQPMSEKPTQHFHLFPKPIAELMNKYSVNELHLSLVRGFWDSDKWGYPFVPAASGAAELWAWFSQNTRNVDSQWRQLTQSLSGMFCASLNQLADSSHFVKPRWSFRPAGVTRYQVSGQPERHLRYGQLPHESVCTENLTPWVNLLPCKNRAGLVKLVVEKKLFMSRYYALTLAVRPVCWNADCTLLGVESRQTLTVVLDRFMLNEAAESIPSWSLLEVTDTCPLADHSRIIVVPLARSKLAPSPTHSLTLQHRSKNTSATTSPSPPQAVSVAVYEIDKLLASEKSRRLRITVNGPWQKFVSRTAVGLTKYATGVGNEMGGVRSVITSRHGEHLTVVYTDLLPWFTRMEYRSLEVAVNGRARKPRQVFYRPSRARSQMAHLELVLDLPAGARLTVAYRFRKLLQRWNEYPPDANHGFYLPAASLSFQLSGSVGEVGALPPLHPVRRALPQWAATYAQFIENWNQNSATATPSNRTKQPQPENNIFIHLHSECVLVSMPTPDFSMPFNVLCVVCSVVAIAFGTINKYTTTELVASLPRPNPLVRMLAAVGQLVGGKKKAAVPREQEMGAETVKDK